MGKKTLNVVPIQENRKRNVTYFKRGMGLFKKGDELSRLTGCKVTIVVERDDNRIVQSYCSNPDEQISHVMRDTLCHVERAEHFDPSHFIKGEKLIKTFKDKEKTIVEEKKYVYYKPKSVSYVSDPQDREKGEKGNSKDARQRKSGQKYRHKKEEDDDQITDRILYLKEAILSMETESPNSLQDTDSITEESFNHIIANIKIESMYDDPSLNLHTLQ